VTDWEGLQREGRYGEVAALLIEQFTGYDLDALRLDAYGALNRSSEVNLVLQDALTGGCGGGGYYRAEPPTIYLHPSIRRRDNFTLLHELGHHVQQQHPEWAFVLLDLSPHALRLAEETVSNEFAIQVLMPWDGDPLDSRNVHPADVMAGLFENSPASRSAVVHRVARLLPKEAKWILAVSDANGVVESAHTTYADPQPARASNQPGFAALANEAESGPVRRNFAEGIQYATGSQLHEMRAEAVLDPDGRYLFVALTPQARFGTGRMIWPTFECSSPSCGNTFDAKYVKLVWCEKCGDPHCTRCNRCGCDPTDTGRTCPSCNIRLTQAEVELGNHECW
jgi:hypothetical protein